MSTAHELFPPLLCRGCGKHGLSLSAAKQHRGRGMEYCRGGTGRSRDQECSLCGHSFVDTVERMNFAGMMKKHKRVWSGKQIYLHKLAHLQGQDETE